MCAVPKEEEDELELYLAEKEESNLSIDLLKYWKRKSRLYGRRWQKWSSNTSPRLPLPLGSSVCSLRGWQDRSCMMTSLKKSAKDSTLECSLSAAFNTD